MATATKAPKAKAAPKTVKGCCPLCDGTTVDINGVYFCKAGREFIAFDNGQYIAAKKTELAATEQLNAYRYDCLTKPIEDAAAEADIEAEIAEFIACDRIAADAQERDLAVEAIEHQIDQLVAEVAAADQAREAALAAAQDRTVDAYLDAVLAGKTDQAAALLAELEATPGLTEQNLNFIRYVKPGPAIPLNTPAMFFPIYPAADGFTWSGAPRAYNSYLDADTARTAWLADNA